MKKTFDRYNDIIKFIKDNYEVCTFIKPEDDAGYLNLSDFTKTIKYNECVTLQRLGVLDIRSSLYYINFMLVEDYETVFTTIRRDMNIDSIIDE